MNKPRQGQWQRYEERYKCPPVLNNTCQGMQKHILENTDNTVCIPVLSVRTVHRRDVDESPMDKPILFKVSMSITYSGTEIALTSVIIIAATGPEMIE